MKRTGKQLCRVARHIYERYHSDGTYILDDGLLIQCQSNARTEELQWINAMANPDERLILELRYLCDKTWLEMTELMDVSESMDVSEATVYRTLGLALVNFIVPADPQGKDGDNNAV